MVTKTDPREIDMRAVEKISEDIQELSTTKAGELLAQWTTDGALSLVSTLAARGFFQSKKFGVYRHGGTVGWLNGLVEYREVAEALV